MANIFYGTREAAQDWTVTSIDVPNDLTPSGTGVILVNTGITVYNLAASGNIVAVIPSGVETTTSKLIFFNNNAGTMTISGTAGAGQTFNYAPTYSVGYSGSHIAFTNYSGTNWVTL